MVLLLRAGPISESAGWHEPLERVNSRCREAIPVRPCLCICFLEGDKGGPNFHFVEIDRYWDRHPARSVSQACLTAKGLLELAQF